MFQTTNQKLFTKFWGLQFKAYTISIYFPHTSTDCAKVQLVHVPKAAARTRFPHDASVSSFLYRSRTRLRCYAHGAPRWCHRPTGRIILYKYELAKVLESTHQTLTYTNQIVTWAIASYSHGIPIILSQIAGKWPHLCLTNLPLVWFVHPPSSRPLQKPPSSLSAGMTFGQVSSRFRTASNCTEEQ